MRKKYLNQTFTLFFITFSLNIYAQWNNPTVYYQFNETSGSLVIDSGINGFDANSDCNNCWAEDGKFDGAFHFNATKRIDLPANDISLSSEKGTVAFWLRLPETSVSDINCIWWAGEYGGDMFGPQNEMHINSEFTENNIWTGGEIAFVINDSLAAKNYFIYSDPWKGENPATQPSGNEITITDNLWHHVACTWGSGSTVALYIDGQTIWDSLSYNPSQTWKCNKMTLGVANQRSNRRLNGYLDELRIYHEALKATEIEEIYNYDPEANVSYVQNINEAYIESLNCYPNPASHIISVFNQIGIETIEIFAITGEKQLVEQTFNSKGIIEINIDQLVSGFYIVKAYKNEKLIAVGKFSKN